MELKIKSENSIAESQIYFLCSTLIIKCIDRITAHLNSHCFGLWKVWLKIQASAYIADIFIVEICILKNK